MLVKDNEMECIWSVWKEQKKSWNGSVGRMRRQGEGCCRDKGSTSVRNRGFVYSLYHNKTRRLFISDQLYYSKHLQLDFITRPSVSTVDLRLLL